AAAVLLAVGAYFGVSHFKGNSKPEPTPAPVTESVANPQLPKSSPSVPVASTPAPSSGQPEVATTAAPKTPAKATSEPEDEESDSRPASKSVKSEPSSDVSTKSESEKPESNALVVKGGKAPSVATKSAPAPDAPPPSMIGMTTSSAVPL